jgi:hypothetical protein
MVSCHRPDDGSLKLKPIASLHITSVCVGCDGTFYKSKVYFCMYTPTEMCNVKKI